MQSGMALHASQSAPQVPLTQLSQLGSTNLRPQDPLAVPPSPPVAMIPPEPPPELVPPVCDPPPPGVDPPMAPPPPKPPETLPPELPLPIAPAPAAPPVTNPLLPPVLLQALRPSKTRAIPSFELSITEFLRSMRRSQLEARGRKKSVVRSFCCDRAGSGGSLGRKANDATNSLLWVEPGFGARPDRVLIGRTQR